MRLGNRPITSMLNAKSHWAKVPLSGNFELTPICNLSCKMCYVRKTSAEVRMHDRPTVTLEQWKRIADQAFEEGMLFLLLTGGEPFLWPDFRELYEYLSEKGFLISINSNGSMITDEWIDWLKADPPVRINITLYGASDKTYEKLCGVSGVYSRVVSNIDKLLEAGIRIKLNASMTPYNVQDMEAIAAFAKERKLLLEMSSYMFPPTRRDPESTGKNERFTPQEAAFYTLEQQRLLCDEEEYERYLRRAAEGMTPPPGLDEGCIDPLDGTVKCQAGKGAFWITWDGWMTPCGTMSEPRSDVVHLGFQEAWKEIVKATDKMRLSGVCGSCKNKFICHCCAAMAVTETGSPEGIPKYLCEMADEIRKQAEVRLRK